MNPDPNSLPLFIRAIAFAAEKHRHQRRKDTSASPYINHPIALTRILSCEVGIDHLDVLCGAVLHDTLEDTETTLQELESEFGAVIARIVMEVSDDKTLPKAERKRRQIEHAPHLSYEARLVKLADKISNCRDIADSAPANWSEQRKMEYYDWAKAVVDGIRGTHAGLESIFDTVYARKHELD